MDWEAYYTPEGYLYYYNKVSGEWQWDGVESPTGIEQTTLWYCELCNTTYDGSVVTGCSSCIITGRHLRFDDIVYYNDGSTGSHREEGRCTSSRRCKRLTKQHKSHLYELRPDLQPQRYSKDAKETQIDDNTHSRALTEFFRTSHSQVTIDEIKTMLQDGLPNDYMDKYTADTLLLVSCRRGYSELTAVCLQYHAVNDPHPSFGQTAVQAAIESCQSRCLRLLLNHFSPSEELVNAENPDGSFSIHVACERGDVKLLELLLSHDADVTRVDPQLRTAGHLAAIGDHISCLRLLFTYEADGQLEEGDLYGNTMLHLASRYGNLNSVRFLLETAVNPQAHNNSRATPVDLSILEQHTDCTALLLEYATDYTILPPPAPKKLGTYDEAIDDLVALLQSSKELKDLIMLQTK